MTKNQRQKITQIMKWFLFSQDSTFDHNNPKKYSKCTRVSLKRLAQPKEKGGFNLTLIDEMLDSYKAKIIAKGLELPRIYTEALWKLGNLEFHSKRNYIHPFAHNNKTSKKIIKYKSKWFTRAIHLYKKLPKIIKSNDFKEDPKIKMFNIQTNQIAQQPGDNTIPILLTRTGKPKKCQNTNKWRKLNFHFAIEKPNKPNESEDCKFKIKHILNNLQLKRKPILTKTQQKWIQNRTLNPIKMLKAKTSTRIGIQDFMHRIARNQNNCNEDCALCGVKMGDSTHLISQCTVVKQWEREIGFAKLAKRRRKYQFTKMSNSSKFERNAMWIVNWSIWKTYQTIKHDESIKQEKYIHIYKSMIKQEEFRFLLLHKNKDYSSSARKRHRMRCLTKHLRFYTLDQSQNIETIKIQRIKINWFHFV